MSAAVAIEKLDWLSADEVIAYAVRMDAPVTVFHNGKSYQICFTDDELNARFRALTAGKQFRVYART